VEQVRSEKAFFVLENGWQTPKKKKKKIKMIKKGRKEGKLALKAVQKYRYIVLYFQ
jgi:hypothetical protein